MSVETVETATFLPGHPGQLAPVIGFLAAHEQHRGTAASPSYTLVGIDEHDRIELPEAIHQALTKVVAALHAGKAVTIAPQTMTLTTQQAADLLGVSRPTVVRLINDDVLPTERIGNRHRLLLDDVLSYRDERRNRQYNALAATADIDSNDDPETTRKQLREARRAVAARRKTAPRRS
ncbi:excisionase family DNA binding domain [Mycobacterium lepraemurium]|nr:helix-turn-helix domain-containing protein [Mycobacterium lepraemurium]ATA29318.1 excisionase family DNA binding domain [Mycobacterium lepraemurium]